MQHTQPQGPVPARRRILAAILCMGVLAISAVQLNAQEAAQVPAILHSLLAGTTHTPPLSGLQLSLMRAGGTGESLALGMAQQGADGPVPLSRAHKVRVASISKLAVAVGVLRLVERDLLDLDADVSQALGWPLRNPAYPDSPITARQLLSHTSSLRDGSAYFIAAGAGELRDFFTPGSEFWDNGAHFAATPGQAPGDYFEYTNLNFGVLATLIEQRSGQRFDQYMAEQVLAPLGLDPAARFDPCAVPDSLRAAGFRKRAARDDAPWEPQGPWVAQVDDNARPPRCVYGLEGMEAAEAFLAQYPLGSNATLFSPQGGLRASADDLLRILQMLAGGGSLDGRRLLTEASVAAMLAPQWTLNAERSNGRSAGEGEPGSASENLMQSYGLSVHRIRPAAWGFADAPALLLGHLGEAYGVLSMALYDPHGSDGIAAIITGTADDPGRAPGHSPLYRVEEELLRWWFEQGRR